MTIQELEGRPQHTKRKVHVEKGKATVEGGSIEFPLPTEAYSPVAGEPLKEAPAVGDPNSDAKGSGARWNAGKVPYDMLPIQLLNDWLGRHVHINIGDGTEDEIIAHLGSYQAGNDKALDLALAAAAGEGAGLEVFAEAAKVFQHVTTREIKPYPKWNWMKGMQWSVPIGCVLRHAQAIQRGEVIDPETGFLHFGHIQCNLIMLLLYRETYKEGDDRPPKGLLPA